VIYGLPRYSSYRVLIFLLTENGVWEYRVDLDFTDGTVRNQETSSFRYESLVRVRVIEVGVKFAGERRHIVVIKDNDLAAVTDERQGLVVSRALWLSLANRDDIQLVLENFDGLSDEESEDRDQLEELALGASGAAGAVRILQSVAGEGRDWIARQRQRRDRRLQEWARNGRGSGELTGPPLRTAIPQPPVPQAPNTPRRQAQPAAARSAWATDYPREAP
jgi:hypothetical protein